jgi:hypothetical protein
VSRTARRTADPFERKIEVLGAEFLILGIASDMSTAVDSAI